MNVTKRVAKNTFKSDLKAVKMCALRMEHRRDFTDQRTFGLTHNSSLWYVQNQSQNFTTSTWASPPTAPPTCSQPSDGPEAPENRPK